MNEVAKPGTLSLSKLICDIKTCADAEQKFCFILGAGASISSGIPTGRCMAQEWIEHLKKKEPNATEKWLKENEIDEDNPGEKYSMIYERRFRTHPHLGFIWLQNKMEDAIPSPGYYYLASILSNKQSSMKLVITTNFDSLIEDAIFMYTGKKPLVVSHESLASYLSNSTNRPIIAKIHRDLMLHPISHAEGTSKLKETWKPVLKDVFKECSPIVIGYAGNDGSLMDILKNAANENKEKKPIYWCHMKNEVPNNTISELVHKSGGFLIPIENFDEAMNLFGNAFKQKFSENDLWERYYTRIERYKELDGKIGDTLNKDDDLSEDRKALRASRLKAIDVEIEKVLNLIKTRPTNQRLYYNLGELYAQLKDNRNAVNAYDKAIYFSPYEPMYYNARGLSYQNMKEYEKAIKDYSKAIELDPNNVEYYINRAEVYTEQSERNKANEDMAKAEELGYDKKVPVHFHKSCISKIEKKFDIQLDKEKTTTYFNKERNFGITCAVSKKYHSTKNPLYWFAFRQLQIDFLERFKEQHVSFGCGDSDSIFVFDYETFKSFLPKMSTSHDDEAHRKYWHVKIKQDGNRYHLLTKGEPDDIDITEYKI